MSAPTADGSLRQTRRRLLEAAAGAEFCTRYSDAADAWLRGLFAAATEGSDRGLALVAVGGLGRRVLLPGSDLDLLLVHGGRRDVRRVAERVWYPIWDEGVGLDHSVRSLREVASAAEEDLRVALGLLDARLVAGDADLGGDLLARRDRLWSARRERWLPQVVTGLSARHRASGDVAFLLEPDLKEGRGGLRDVHTLQAIAGVTPVLAPVVHDPGLHRAAADLRTVLVALQGSASSGSATRTRLLLQDQDAVAVAVGDADADALMSRVAAAGRAVAWASDEGWRRVASWLAGPGRRAGADRAVGPGLVLRDGEIALSPEADPGADPALVLRAAVAAVEHGAPLSRPALDRLAAEAAAPPDPWPEELRHALVRLLAAGPPAIPVVEALDQRHLVVRLLPEWQSVRNLPQRNAYHRFTVDRHLLEAAVEAAALVRRVTRPDLLIVGALLHDIGKGQPGDHSEAGMKMAENIARRMGFDDADVDVIARLARHHLLLPDTATRRDLDDPATAAAVAGTAGDLLTLQLLDALAEADGRATGPAAWGTWKEGLVRSLVAGASAHLEGRPAFPLPPEPTADQRRMMATGRLGLSFSGSQLTVVAADRPGLLGVVTGVLALRGVDVRTATTSTGEEGMALLVFDVAPLYADLPSWDRVAADIEAALAGRLPVAERLAEQDAAERRRRRRRAAAPARVEVTVDHEASARATVVEVRAPDAPGTLSRIATALAGAGVTITSARAATYGAEVVDAFYVVGADGEAIAPGDASEAVAGAVAAALGPGEG